METSVGLKIFAAVVAVTIPLTTSLAHADDDISRSEELFASGMRGTHQSDLTGMQMRPMSPTLRDDQALRDVAAYIRTLRQ